MGNKIMTIVIIVLLVLLLGAVGFVAIYGIQAINNSGMVTENQGSISVGKTLSQKDISLIKFSNPISSNLKKGADGEPHVASLTLSIGVDNTEKTSEEMILLIEDREPVVREIVATLLSNVTYEELTEQYNFTKEELKQNIMDKLKLEFATNLIVSITSEILYQ